MYSRGWPKATPVGEPMQKIEDSEAKSSKLPPLHGGGPGGVVGGGTGASRAGEGGVVIAVKPKLKEHREIRSPAHGGAEARKAALAAIQAADGEVGTLAGQMHKMSVGQRGQAESSPGSRLSPRDSSLGMNSMPMSQRGRSIFRTTSASPRGSASPSGYTRPTEDPRPCFKHKTMLLVITYTLSSFF